MANRIALFDADGTLHEGFSFFPLYQVFSDEGYITPSEGRRVSDILAAYKSGESDYRTFVGATLVIGAEVLKGKQLSIAEQLATKFFQSPDFNWFGYVEPLLSRTSESDVKSVLVTAEPQFISNAIASALEFDEDYSSHFGVNSDGTFDGTVLSALTSRDKGELVTCLVEDMAYSAGFGDSEGDIGLLQAVDLPICVQPTPGLRSYAHQHNWSIMDNPEAPLNIVGQLL